MSKLTGQNNDSKAGERSWGPVLFAVTLALLLLFFWWMLLYSGGVTPHHG